MSTIVGGGGDPDDGTTSDDFVTADGIKWAALVATLVSSSVLAFFDGLAQFLANLGQVPADWIDDGMSWLANTAGILLSIPQGTIEFSWGEVLDLFPLAGPLDWAIGVLLIMAFLVFTNWVSGRVKEAIYA